MSNKISKSTHRPLKTQYRNGEVLAISYDISISGVQLDLTKKECIQSIDIKETVDGANSATIKIHDPDFLYIEDNIFLEENTVQIQMRWSNTSYTVSFDGFISAIDIDFQSNGIPIVTATCMDSTHTMNREKKDNTFTNTTSAEVVKQIVASYGYTCVIEEGYTFPIQETITQSKQTDIDFIQKLAKDEVHPFSARLEGSVFYYVKKGSLALAPKMELTYKNYPHDIISFSPKINKETKQDKISKAKVDTATKEVTATEGTVDNSKQGSVSASSTSKKSSYTYNPSKRNWSKS